MSSGFHLEELIGMLFRDLGDICICEKNFMYTSNEIMQKQNYDCLEYYIFYDSECRQSMIDSINKKEKNITCVLHYGVFDFKKKKHDDEYIEIIDNVEKIAYLYAHMQNIIAKNYNDVFEKNICIFWSLCFFVSLLPILPVSL